MRRRPTIIDVAREAGVSTGTVSHVVNGSARVRAETRERVEAAIRRLAYRPNELARSLTALSREADADRLARPRLLSVGYISVDYTARVAVLPHRDDRVTAQRIAKTLGGPAANVAAAAAALGGAVALDVELASAVGDDADSEWALQRLAALGVHVLPTGQPPQGRLSRCLVIVEANGARTIINEPFQLSGADLAFPLAPDAATRPQCLHVEGYQAAAMAQPMRAFRAAGWRVTLHGAGLPDAMRRPDAFADLLGMLDVAFVNRDLAAAVLDHRGRWEPMVDAFGAFLARVPSRGVVVLTLDDQGAAIFAPGQAAAHLPAPHATVVDATGAGDAFAGVFLGCWLNGMTPAEAARRAVVGGSLAVTGEGAQGRLASAAEIEAMLDAPALEDRA